MSAVSVAATPTNLLTGIAGYGNLQVLVTNNSAVTVWIDSGATVAVGTGIPLAANASVSLDVVLRPDGNGTQLYGIVATGTADVRRLVVPRPV